MNIEYPRILPTGDRALTVEFGNEIDEKINSHLMGFINEINRLKIKGIEELVPSFRAVLIHYNPGVLSYDEICHKIKEVLANPFDDVGHRKRIVEVPVCYGNGLGPDIEHVAEHAGLSVEEVIDIHSREPYLIYMLGFQPGFPYLGGLDERIHTPRLDSPRLKLEAGSVGIGGAQTGLYPMESPGGWQIIGLTPVRCYNPDKENPIPYNAGDYIKFVPVDYEEYLRLKEIDAKGEYEFTVTEG
ncbi:MAG: 5-oxoprolinase subunit PxpB [Lachnospiraceae bacterium]|nr:5-oxoprolinase subunit PxpB [Lachnospiraceae bacterium]